jgi:hypothetical protein
MSGEVVNGLIVFVYLVFGSTAIVLLVAWLMKRSRPRR